MNTLGLLEKCEALQENRSIHDSMNIPKIKFISELYFRFSDNDRSPYWH